MEIKDIDLSKDGYFEIRWAELSANIFDDSRDFCARSYDSEYCCTGVIVGYEENLDNENPMLRVIEVYRNCKNS